MLTKVSQKEFHFDDLLYICNNRGTILDEELRNTAKLRFLLILKNGCGKMGNEE